MSDSAYAVCDGCVVSAVGTASIAITGAIGTLGSTLSTLLEEIDNDIAAVGAKMAGTSALNGNTQREMASQVQQQSEIDQANQETQMPIDPCSTSGSNYAMQAAHAANKAASSYRPGGSYSPASNVLSHMLNSAAPSVGESRRASASIHEATYCSALEVSLGYPGCSSSQMPDADANADSLFIGAGLPGKDTDLTFTPQQIDAAHAWERMATDPEPPESITKAEAGTEAGKLYIAMQKAYSANISTAQNSINMLIAQRAPFAGSAQLIADINQSSQAAQMYFQANESPNAKALGQLSWEELKSFEAGRRWRNPYWIIQMGAQADPTQLARENLFTTAFISDMTYQNEQHSQHIEVLLGQILAELTRANERAALNAQLQKVHATNAK
ncbi:conjugal transfer protein TraW [Paraburkholderia sp. BR10872]|uniref:conjugal transfer protein TraW n=1 Tax=Paraburkholderia sp. BR10872 TaxID=3236989 RepID=UPI0034D1B91A